MASEDVRSVSKRQRIQHERHPGIIYTVSSPSKTRMCGNGILGLLDTLKETDLLAGAKDSDEIENVSDALTLELKQLAKTRPRYMFAAELGRGLGLIKFAEELDPAEMVHKLLTTHLPSTVPPFVARIIPIQVVCAPNIASFEAVALPAIRSKFQDIQEPTTWKLVVDTHGKTNLQKDSIVQRLLECIDEKHEVSIQSPDIVVMVQVCQTVCGVGFLKDYDLLCEYNLRKCVSQQHVSNPS